MDIFQYKTKKVVKPIYKYPALLVCLLLLILFARPVLISLAKFLELPQSDAHCDVIVVEGGPALSEYFMRQALKPYLAGQVDKIALIIHTYDLNPTIFGIKNYRPFVDAAFDSLGVPQEDYELLMLDIQDPYTYNSAVALKDTLQDVRSILVFNDNFHMRRSYLAFKKVFANTDITIHPYTYEIYLNAENWWTSGNGWRRVVGEYIKLTFYWINGYI